jgi:hypothetical protein
VSVGVFFFVRIESEQRVSAEVVQPSVSYIGLAFRRYTYTYSKKTRSHQKRIVLVMEST